jgi:hypothetical protein
MPLRPPINIYSYSHLFHPRQRSSTVFQCMRTGRTWTRTAVSESVLAFTGAWPTCMHCAQFLHTYSGIFEGELGGGAIVLQFHQWFRCSQHGSCPRTCSPNPLICYAMLYQYAYQVAAATSAHRTASNANTAAEHWPASESTDAVHCWSDGCMCPQRTPPPTLLLPHSGGLSHILYTTSPAAGC